jgi:anaerobic magnesium-protoporphyrin IX monomethyl ester cyclase
MRVALIGAELEENIGLRYMASSLEARGHDVAIVPFNVESDLADAVAQTLEFAADIAGLSMVFTSRGLEFCRLATTLREAGFRGHIIAGGHFACLNAEALLRDFPVIDSIGLGEGEELMVDLAAHLDSLEEVAGITYRRYDGEIVTNPSRGNPDDLDALPFPQRSTFHSFFGKRIATVLSSRGCWRDCAFCSINAWYKQGGGKKFRVRSIGNIVEEMRELYFKHDIRIFNFQDDNFFLPNPEQAAHRFERLRDRLREEGVTGIAIAVKARPDSITEATIRPLDDLGLFRVFLGVENASQNGLNALNRDCSVAQVLESLRILNDFHVHVAYNLLMFELDTTMEDVLINLRFMERHIDNPANFCRAEAYAGTGLEAKLRAEGRLLGDYFGLDYRIKDPNVETFHQIANYAFFDRNFNDDGLHYFNMQVDFYYQILRRFYPDLVSQTLRASVRNFIKRTNLDTYERLSEIYDYVVGADIADQVAHRGFAQEMRHRVDAGSAELRTEGERLLAWMESAYEAHVADRPRPEAAAVVTSRMPVLDMRPMPYAGLESFGTVESHVPDAQAVDRLGLFGLVPAPIPYEEFRRRIETQE